MTDKTEPPVTPSDAKPAAPRRRAPRKTTAKPGGATASATSSARKSTKSTAEKAAVTSDTTPVAAKPKRAPVATPRSTSRGTKRTVVAAPRKPARSQAPVTTTSEPTAPAAGRKWGIAAIAGSLAAAAALLSLRSSKSAGSSDDAAKQPADQPKHAHQADGTDSSASFTAGIADEGTIPEKG